MVGRAEHLRAGQGGRPVQQQRGRLLAAEEPRRRAVEGAGRRARVCGPWPAAAPGRPSRAQVDPVDPAGGQDHGHVGRGRVGHRGRLPLRRACAAAPGADREAVGARRRGHAADRGALAERLAPVLRPGVGPRLVPAQRAEGHDRWGGTAPPPGGARSPRRARRAPPCPSPGRPRPRAARSPATPAPPWPTTRRRRSPAARPPRCRPRAPPAPGSVPTIAPVPTRARQGVGTGHPVEQRRRGVAQSLLVAREVEVHGGAVYGRP